MKEDKRISVVLVSVFVVLTFQYLILIFFGLEDGGSGAPVQLLSKLLAGLLFLTVIVPVIRRSWLEAVLSFTGMALLFILHYAVFAANRLYMEDLLMPLFMMGLLAFVYTLSIRDLRNLLPAMTLASHIIFAIGLVIAVLVFTGTGSIGGYSMSLSYYLLMPALIYLDRLMTRPDWQHAMLFVLTLLVILTLGSRGALLGILVFLFLKLFSPGMRAGQKLGIVGVVGASVFAYILLADRLLMGLYRLFLSMGHDSRTLLMMVEGEIELSGRDLLYRQVMGVVWQRPLFGLGLAGDRVVLQGNYVHSIVLELMTDFGFVFGLALFAGLMVLVFNALRIRDGRLYSLVIMWISMGLIPLFVSGSYLIDMKFWILAGVLVNLARQPKEAKAATEVKEAGDVVG